MKKHRKILFRLFLVLLVSVVLALFIHLRIHPTKYIKPAGNTLEVSVPYIAGDEVDEDVLVLARGTEVTVQSQSADSSEVSYEGTTFTIDNDLLVDSLDECVQADVVYVRQLVNLREEKDGALSDTAVKKGEILKVISASARDLDPDSGMVKWYEVSKDGRSWWIDGQYVETEESAIWEYDGSNVLYSTYWDAYYGDGFSKKAYIDSIDWKPVNETVLEDNVRPDEIHGFHVSLANLLADPDYYLGLMDTTVLNTIVVELKNEAGLVMYDSDAVRQWLTDADQALDERVSMDELAAIMKRFNDAGWYTVARISCFKDQYFSAEYPDESLLDADGGLLWIANSSWASPYSRMAWMYNADLAVEASQWFDEVQLDYVRFPEGLAQLVGQVDLQNDYNESKAQTLQSFAKYVADRVHAENTYLSVDVFGLVVNTNDDQDLGQFVPALLMVTDSVNPMAYSDHFSAGAFGIDLPWEHQGDTVYAFTQSASNVYTDADQYVPWIQAYSNTAQDVADQIQAIEDNGYKHWMLWAIYGDPESLDAILPAIAKDTGE